jgi:ferrous iron transport protein A
LPCPLPSLGPFEPLLGPVPSIPGIYFHPHYELVFITYSEYIFITNINSFHFLGLELSIRNANNYTMSTEQMKLTDLKEGQKGIIVSILGGRNVTQRLTDMGLTPGTEFKMSRRGRLCPVEISVRGSRLAIGCGVASKILVEAKE